MKKLIKLFVVVAVAISANFANANDTRFEVKIIRNKVFQVTVSDLEGLAVSSIKDKSGNTLYKKKTKEESLTITFDFSELDEGNYEFVVKDDSKVQSIPVLVTEEGIEIKKEALKKTFFPKMEQLERDTYLVRLLSDDSNDLFVSIKSAGGITLIEDTLDGQLGLIGRKYQFNSGEYAVTLISNDFVTTSYLTIE